MNESCHTYEWVMSHIWMSHVTHMNDWVMSHIWMSHVTHMNDTYESHMNESCHTYGWITYECVVSHIWMNESCRTYHHKRWLQEIALLPLNIGHLCGKWPIKIRGPMSLRESSPPCTLLPYKRFTSHICESHIPSHIWMRHVTHMNESCPTYECVMSHIWMSHVPHVNASCHAYDYALELQEIAMLLELCV